MSATNPLQMVLARLSDVREVSSGRWQATCPSHEDSTPSLSVSAGHGARALLHCHAGCEPEDVVRALGLTWSDLFNSSRNRASRAIDKTYDYVDESGALLYQVVRFAPKDFRQRRPVGAGGWINNVDGVPKVLYRLPVVLQAVQEGTPVWIVEGEKDADRLASLGFTATTTVGGAGKWRKEYNDALRGAHVFILPDNDEPGQAHTQKVARSLHGTAKTIKVVPLPNVPAGGDVSDYLDAVHDDVRELLTLVREASAWSPLTSPSEVPSDQARPMIVVRDELNAVTNEAIRALQNGHPVYVRSRALVTVARDGTPQHRGLQRVPGSPVIVPLETEHVLAMLDQGATWVQKGRGKNEGDLLPARPPAWVAQQVVHGQLEWPFPYLEAVIEMPTIRADGSILDTPGWDAASSLLYEPLPNVTWPRVPDDPTSAEVRAAVETLLDPVREFPFIASSDRAAYVAAVLTLLARHTIAGPVPMFAVRSPTPASGKGLLVSVIAEIGTGRAAAVSTMTEEGAEWKKLVLSLAMEGAPMILLDNLTGAVGSDHLAAALTATEVMDRKLGSNQTVRAPLVTTWFCAGNNLMFKKTLARRVIPIDLDPKVERPEDRRFQCEDLLRHVQAERPTLVAAALTILRAYAVAGKPRRAKGPRMGSFEAWDDAIRGAVLWAGLDDPASTESEERGRGRIRSQSDEDAEQHVVLLNALEAAFPNGTWFSGAEVIARMYAEGAGLTERREAQTLRDAIVSVLPGTKSETISAKGLGPLLRDLRDRVCDGRVLRARKHRGRHGGFRWAVLAMNRDEVG